jgi:hypothetical protein
LKDAAAGRFNTEPNSFTRGQENNASNKLI